LGDYNLEESSIMITNLKEEMGLSGLDKVKCPSLEQIKEAQKTPTCKVRRIDYPLFRNVEISIF